jgi:hypothetical protein
MPSDAVPIREAALGGDSGPHGARILGRRAARG